MLKKVIIKVAKVFINLIYLLMKLFPLKKQIVYISMQSNNISLDFELLKEEITNQNPNIKQVFLCKKMKSSLNKKQEYLLYVFKMAGFIFKAIYYLSTSKVCIAESYCVPISILKHKKSLKIIQIWHASGAVKKFGYQILNKEEGKSKEIAQLMCMHKNYDYVIAPSEITKKVFAEAFNISEDKVIKLGLPRLEYITNPIYDKTKEIYEKYPELKSKKVILYVPTFRKDKSTDLKEMLNYNLDKEKYKLIIKLHPLEKNNVPEEYKFDTKYTSYDLIKIADYIITDYSILSVEASILKKPIFLYLYDLEDYNINRGLNINLNEELKTFTSKNINDIMKKIEENDFNLEELEKYRNKYIQIDSNNTTFELSKFILSLVKKEEKNKKMKIKNNIKKFIKKNVFIRKIARKVYFKKNNLKYKKVTKNIKVEENLIVFASFKGRSYCDSPKAIYEYLIKEEKYKDYKFVWAFKNIEKHNSLKNNRNTTLVDINSTDFLKIMGKAKYWILNYKIQDYIFPKQNQIFVQCWHGTPLKRLGCDLQHFENAMNSLSEIKERYHIEALKFNYFLSPSKFATDKFISTWDLSKIGKEEIMVEEGYPRNDFLFNFKENDLNRIKEKLKLNNIDKKIILYAPTYRDNQHSTEIGYTYQTQIDFDKLKTELSDEYIILFRAHWLVAQTFEFEKYKDFIVDVSNYDDINELYIISDLLVTDYSSVFFDYANLKRPIIFYMYDLEDYRDNIRGFYLNLEELPGKIVKQEEELITEIKDLSNKWLYDEKYKNFNNKFNYLDDGKATKRVVEKIINKKEV